MLSKRQVASMIAKIEKHRDAVAKVRDDLDAAIGELEALRDSCERAWDDMANARDALSEHA